MNKVKWLVLHISNTDVSLAVVREHSTKTYFGYRRHFQKRIVEAVCASGWYAQRKVKYDYTDSTGTRHRGARLYYAPQYMDEWRQE